MKKKILFAALALCIVNGAIAQGIKLGVKAGANLSTITELQANPKMKLGFHVGGFLDFKFSESLSLQPEILYSLQGYDYQWPEETESGSVNLNYINVPVLLKINIAEGLSAEVGPQVGILFYASDKFGSEPLEDLTDMCQTIDVTALAGLSYTFAGNFVIGARYGLGLTNIFKPFNGKTSLIQFSLGYKF